MTDKKIQVREANKDDKGDGEFVIAEFHFSKKIVNDLLLAQANGATMPELIAIAFPEDVRSEIPMEAKMSVIHQIIPPEQ